MVWGTILNEDSEFFLYPALVTRRKKFFSMSLPSSKLAISVILIVILVSQTMQIIDILIWEGKYVLLITCSANLVSLLFLPIWFVCGAYLSVMIGSNDRLVYLTWERFVSVPQLCMDRVRSICVLQISCRELVSMFPKGMAYLQSYSGKTTSVVRKFYRKEER